MLLHQAELSGAGVTCPEPEPVGCQVCGQTAPRAEPTGKNHQTATPNTQGGSQHFKYNQLHTAQSTHFLVLYCCCFKVFQLYFRGFHQNTVCFKTDSVCGLVLELPTSEQVLKC